MRHHKSDKQKLDEASARHERSADCTAISRRRFLAGAVKTTLAAAGVTLFGSTAARIAKGDVCCGPQGHTCSPNDCTDLNTCATVNTCNTSNSCTGINKCEENICNTSNTCATNTCGATENVCNGTNLCITNDSCENKDTCEGTTGQNTCQANDSCVVNDFCTGTKNTCEQDFCGSLDGCKLANTCNTDDKCSTDVCDWYNVCSGTDKCNSDYCDAGPTGYNECSMNTCADWNECERLNDCKTNDSCSSIDACYGYMNNCAVANHCVAQNFCMGDQSANLCKKGGNTCDIWNVCENYNECGPNECGGNASNVCMGYNECVVPQDACVWWDSKCGDYSCGKDDDPLFGNLVQGATTSAVVTLVFAAA